MQIRHLPPMGGGSDDHGHDDHGHDSKHEVICIEARRVCDFCFQEHRIERQFTATFPTNQGLLRTECEILEDQVVCRVVERRAVNNNCDSKEVICVAVTVPVVIRVLDASGAVVATLNEQVVFLKQAVLCAPSGTDIDCQVDGECCCVADPVSGLVQCVFDFCVVLQSHVIVRVLVPTLGNCQPKECRHTVLGCPPKFPKECKDCGCDHHHKDCN